MQKWNLPPPPLFQAISYSHRLKPIHISPNKQWFLCLPLFFKTVSKLFFSLHISESYKKFIVDRLIRHQFIQMNLCQVQYFMYVNLWEKNPRTNHRNHRQRVRPLYWSLQSDFNHLGEFRYSLSWKPVSPYQFEIATAI